MTHRHDPRPLHDPTVLGDGLVLSRDADHGYGLVALCGGRSRSLGTFRDVRDAWRAVDALDLDELSTTDALAA